MYDISENRQPISVVRIVVVRSPITVDITEVLGVAAVRGALPPVVG